MGIVYMVVPIGDEINDWLDELGVSYPENEHGRLPYPVEIRKSVSSLSGYRSEENNDPESGHWQILIEHASGGDHGPWTMINSIDPVALSDECQITFEKGYPELISAILLDLSYVTGPLALVPDTGDLPLVLTKDMNLRQALEDWEFMTEIEDGFEYPYETPNKAVNWTP